ncbi:TIGR03792 family protein [Spirulina sp. CS-785/01]|uniref:TIGR03792 family protein n=1 Tax=Spirulina sp. CS-785/01 TaxID=3021716 RepID=UPI003FA711FA
MVIEWLQFRVNPEHREQFVQQDAEIWTPVLARYPGFSGKEVWVSPDSPEIIIIIRWETREQWKAIPETVLIETEAKFAQAMGNTYDLVEGKEYQLRKFPYRFQE